MYDVASEMQIRIAKEWLDAVDMADKASAMFQSLSYEAALGADCEGHGEIPVAAGARRAHPGLDEINRERILGFMSAIEARQHSTLLFVSHREDEFLPLFKQHVHLRLSL